MENTKLTYSEIVYLYADQFLSERAKFVNIENHPSGEKYPSKTLCHLMIVSAIEYLKRYEYASFEVKDVKKLLIFNGKDIVANKLKEVTQDISGIEHNLLANINKDTKLEYAIYHLLGSDETLPSGHMMAISKESLGQKGYFDITEEKKFLVKVKKFTINQEKYESAKSQIQEVSSALSELRNNTEQYKTYLDAVKKGVAMREERADTSDD